MTTRRDLLVALSSTLVAPLGAFAQPQNKIWRVGFLTIRSRPASLDADDLYGAFLRGLGELGYIEGKNLVIEWRFADNKPDRLSGLVAELVQLNVDVLVVNSTPATLSAQKATTTIPIVMVSVGDPVGSGLVKSLARPGGNITGLSNFARDTNTKRLELLLEMVPKVARVAILVNPTNPGNYTGGPESNLLRAAQKLRVELLRVEARTPQDFDSAFSLIRKQNAGALMVSTDALFAQQASRIAGLAAKNRLPSIYAFSEYAEAGGLMSYGANLADQYRRAATYVDKILKGAKPGDLPVEQPTKFELVINLKTAKTLGITIPPSILVRADRLIE